MIAIKGALRHPPKNDFRATEVLTEQQVEALGGGWHEF